MITDTKEINKVIDLADIAPVPRPIAPVECKCGCGYTFQPARRDQVYLNKQHADFCYNQNTRKFKHWKRKKVEKILMGNDKALEKHFKAHRQENCATCILDALKADGLNTAYCIGIDEKDKKKYYSSYNYCYHIYVNDNIEMIKIYKG